MLKLLHEVGRSVAVLDDDKLLLVYRYGLGWPKPHFHPMYAPHSSRIMTLHAPHDWAHHRGLMWSWGRVAPQSDALAAVNFWEERVRDIDPDGRVIWPAPLPEAQRGVIRHTGFRCLEPGRDRAKLCANHEWLRVGTDTALLHSTMDAEVYPMRAAGWFVDLTYTLRAADEPMQLLPAEPDSLYGASPYGLACQLTRELCNGALLDSQGPRQAHGTVGEAKYSSAQWCDYSGLVDDDDNESRASWFGVTLMDHPANPGHPAAFYASCGSTPFVSVAPLRDAALCVPLEPALTWRYRVWVHAGRGQREMLDGLYSEFIA